MRLRDIRNLLWRNLFIVALCAAIGAVCAFAFAKASPSRYSAFASLAIEGQTFAIPELEGVVHSPNNPDPMPLVRTEVQALMSHQLLQSVIAKLGLDTMPEFNPTLRAPSALHKMRLLLDELLPTSPQSSEPSDAIAQAVENEVFRNLVISQDNRSFVIGVSFTSEDAKLSADFVNSLVQTYLDSKMERRASANRDANAEMLQRIDNVRLRLGKLEMQMRDLRTNGELVALRAGSVGQQQLEELATAAARAGLERAEIEAEWQRATTLSKGGASSDLASVLNSPTIARLRDLESQASQRLAELTSHYGPNYPGVRSAQADLQAAREQLAGEARRIVSSLSAQLAVARAREADTQRQLQAGREAGVKSENAHAELDNLQQEVNAQRTLYQSLLQDLQKTVAQSTTGASPLDVRVISSAVQPALPSSPNTKLATVSGGIGGLVVGLLFALLRVHNSDTLSTPDDANAATGLPIASLVANRGSKRTLLAAVRANPSGGEAEALRLLQAQVQGRGHISAPRSMLFVSLDDDNSGADVAIALAYVAAGDGEKVILVEGNLRKPHVARMLGLEQTSLLTILEGKENWREALLSDRSGQLDFLVTRQATHSSYALLCGPRFQNLLVDLHEAYSLVILSGPSAVSPDTLALASEANATVLVIRSEKATRTAAREAAARLEEVCRNKIIVALIGALTRSRRSIGASQPGQ